MKAPPPLPEETLRRVLRVGRYHGTCVAFVAGLFALGSASAHDVSGALAGLMVAGGGAIEMHGASLLRSSSPKGVRWLIGSQICVFAAIFGYAVWRLGHPDPLIQAAFNSAMSDVQRQQLREIGMTETDFFQIFSRILYFTLGFVSLLYQGALAVYYARRRTVIVKALETATTE